MDVDIVTSIEIARPPAEVSAFAGDPDNAPAWYANIRTVEWKTARPLRLGSRVAFVARFLGRDIVYTYVTVELVPGQRLVMQTAQGPFPMQTTYTWSANPTGGTRMTLRNRGTPSGFFRLVAPFLSGAIRRANRKDLARLKGLLESRT